MTITKIIGQRIKNYRNQLGLSQEKIAELAGCHPTYIGQIERGEKNATIESIYKISSALQIPLSTLFCKIDSFDENTNSQIPKKCYDLLLSKSKNEQLKIYDILIAIDNYKSLN